MNKENNETIADIVRDMHYCAEKNSAWCCTTVEFETFADRIEAAVKREMADEKRISDAVIQSLRDKKLEMNKEIVEKDKEIARLLAALKPVLDCDCCIFETDKSRAQAGAEDAIKAVNEAKRIYREIKK